MIWCRIVSDMNIVPNLRKGVDIRIAQQLMGHSDISLTANIYTNLTKIDTLHVAGAHGATLGATPGATSK